MSKDQLVQELQAVKSNPSKAALKFQQLHQIGDQSPAVSRTKVAVVLVGLSQPSDFMKVS